MNSYILADHTKHMEKTLHKKLGEIRLVAYKIPLKKTIEIVLKWANLWAMAGDWNMSHLSNICRAYKHIESSILDDIIKCKCLNNEILHM